MASSDNPIEIGGNATLTIFRADRVNKYQHNVTLSLVENESMAVRGTVDIYGPESTVDSQGVVQRFSPAEVNWQALGSKSPEIAAMYATMLQLAAQIAESLKDPQYK